MNWHSGLIYPFSNRVVPSRQKRHVLKAISKVFSKKCFLSGAVWSGTESEFQLWSHQGELTFMHDFIVEFEIFFDPWQCMSQVAHCEIQRQRYAHRRWHFPALYRSLQIKSFYIFCIDKKCLYPWQLATTTNGDLCTKYSSLLIVVQSGDSLAGWSILELALHFKVWPAMPSQPESTTKSGFNTGNRLPMYRTRKHFWNHFRNRLWKVALSSTVNDPNVW